MRPFNLAEEKIRERSLCRREINRRLRILAALIVLNILVLIGFAGFKATVTRKATSIESELANVQGRCISLKRDLGVYRTRSSQWTWHAQLADSSNKWLSLMGSIFCAVPSRVWLSRVESSDSGTLVTIEGKAVSMTSVSDFIRAIKSCEKFSDVQLSSTQATGYDTMSPQAQHDDFRAFSHGEASRNRDSTVAFAVRAKIKLAQSDTVQAVQANQTVPQVEESP